MDPDRITCCGCFGNIFGRLKSERSRGSRRYRRRARYNEREYSIEFENLIEDEDFNQGRSFAVTEEERDLISRGKYDALIEQQKKTNAAIEEELRKQEEDLKLEEEAYKQAKYEAAKVSTQAAVKRTDKSSTQTQRAFDSEEFTSWLSQENLDVASPDLDVDDFDTFLEKVKARSLAGKNVNLTEGNNDSGHESWEATLNEGLQATKIADNALSALSPIDDEDDHTNNVDGYDEQINNTEQKGVKDIEDDEELLI